MGLTRYHTPDKFRGLNAAAAFTGGAFAAGAVWPNAAEQTIDVANEAMMVTINPFRICLTPSTFINLLLYQLAPISI